MVGYCHQTRVVIAFAFGKRRDEVFRKLLEPFSITMFYKDDWGSYSRNLSPGSHTISNKIRKRSNARILPYARVSKGCAVKSFAFLNLLRCMILSLASLSMFGSSDLFMHKTTGAVHDPNDVSRLLSHNKDWNLDQQSERGMAEKTQEMKMCM